MELPFETYGIDIKILFDEKVLSNKTCFWSILQSYTDRLHYYYYDQEKYIIKSINRLDQKNLLTLQLLEGFQNDVNRLNEFIKLNVELFNISVRKFDEKHKVDTFDEELEYFKDTYTFVHGQRLSTILEAIDMYIYCLESTSKAVRSKRASSILSIVQSDRDVVRYSNVNRNREDRSFKKLKGILNFSRFILRKRRGKRLIKKVEICKK